MSAPGLHSVTSCSPPRPITRISIHRSPSDSVHSAPSHPISSPPQQIYVLSADGSSLFLLDPTKPIGNEEPPPYAPYHDRQIPLPQSRHHIDGTDRVVCGTMAGHSRHRASTMSVVGERSPRLPGDSVGPSGARPRYQSTFSHNSLGSLRPRDDRRHSSMSSPDYTRPAFIDEMAPLLPVSRSHPQTDDIGQAVKRRGLWSSIFRGELGEHDDKRGFAAAWRRFWLPVGDGNYWKAMVHLCFINFPFVSRDV